jgi:hypothetical protein
MLTILTGATILVGIIAVIVHARTTCSTNASSLKVKALTREIHTQVREFVERGVTRLAPIHGNPETTSLRIVICGELAIIDQYIYDPQSRCTTTQWYIIRPNGVVDRGVMGRGLRPSDRAWCDSPLTQSRLENVLRVLRSYSPTAVE